ncbi:hypothetical protein [Thermus islandicus]|uniref:hypothetical protein n=1 Tax=Thermus islandicus TaxID=540988 RepID=UPI0003B4297E|nr:hypothetical protein [Thermus islandicus]
MRLLLLLLAVAGLWGARAERVMDRLHGFALDLPEGWRVVLGEGGLLLTDLESAVLVRGMPLKPPKEAARPLLEEARRLSGEQATLHFKPASGGLMLLARNLRYPLPLTQGAMGELVLFALDPQVQAALSGLRYEAAHLLLPGPKSLFAVSAYLPQDLSSAERKEVLGLLRSLEFLGPKERVPYRVEAVPDPLLGVPALRVPVPQGYTLQGSVVDFSETQRRPVFQLSKGGVVLRREVVYLEALAIATPFGGSPSTLWLWNGRAGKAPGFLCARSPEELPALLAQGLWAWETGGPWEVERGRPLRGTSRVARYLEEVREAWDRRMGQQMLMATGRPGDQFQKWRASLDLRAFQGNLRRQAVVEALGFFSYAPSFAASSARCTLYLEVALVHGAPEALSQEEGTLTGVFLGLSLDPRFAALEAERSRRVSAELTRMVLRMNQEAEEFHSWMRRSWTNLLSDQTYARDPATGETFRLYKQSFDTGAFWREPVFGGVMGGVERGGKLEELLQAGGWRRLEESLSGLPGTWR